MAKTPPPRRDVDQDAEKVQSNHDAGYLRREPQPARHVDNREDGERHEEYRREEAGDRRDAQPSRCRRLHAPRAAPAHERQREQYEVREPIQDPRRVVEELKRFLLPDSDDAHNPKRQRHGTDEQNRVHRRPEARVKTREPSRQQPIPTRDHWHPRVARKDDARVRDRARREQQDRERGDDGGHARRTEAGAQRLRNRPDEIHLLRRMKSEH